MNINGIKIRLSTENDSYIPVIHPGYNESLLFSWHMKFVYTYRLYMTLKKAIEEQSLLRFVCKEGEFDVYVSELGVDQRYLDTSLIEVVLYSQNTIQLFGDAAKFYMSVTEPIQSESDRNEN